jgi:hypothetical protein
VKLLPTTGGLRVPLTGTDMSGHTPGVFGEQQTQRRSVMNRQRTVVRLLLGVCLVLTLTMQSMAQEHTSANDARLKRWLEKRPEADANRDGVLTEAEARAFQQQRKTQPTRQTAPPPTHANVKYGPHRLQAFDIWLADDKQPSPVVLYIHGGGFKDRSVDGRDVANQSRIGRRCSRTAPIWWRRC